MWIECGRRGFQPAGGCASPRSLREPLPSPDLTAQSPTPPTAPDAPSLTPSALSHRGAARGRRTGLGNQAPAPWTCPGAPSSQAGGPRGPALTGGLTLPSETPPDHCRQRLAASRAKRLPGCERSLSGKETCPLPPAPGTGKWAQRTHPAGAGRLSLRAAREVRRLLAWSGGRRPRRRARRCTTGGPRLSSHRKTARRGDRSGPLPRLDTLSRIPKRTLHCPRQEAAPSTWDLPSSCPSPGLPAASRTKPRLPHA